MKSAPPANQKISPIVFYELSHSGLVYLSLDSILQQLWRVLDSEASEVSEPYESLSLWHIIQISGLSDLHVKYTFPNVLEDLNLPVSLLAIMYKVKIKLINNNP